MRRTLSTSSKLGFPMVGWLVFRGSSSFSHHKYVARGNGWLGTSFSENKFILTMEFGIIFPVSKMINIDG